MAKKQNKKQAQEHQRTGIENAPGKEDKKLGGPNRPAT